jgi:hypothetical protein
MEAAMWIATASLRDDENWLIDFEGDPDGDWRIAGLTTAGEMKDWLDETSLYSSVSDDSTWNAPKPKSHLLGLTYDGNHDHFLMINTHVFAAAAGMGRVLSDQFFLNRFPDHWVMLASSVANPGGRMHFTVWTWGGTKYVDVPDAVFNSNYYGSVSARVNA